MLAVPDSNDDRRPLPDGYTMEPYRVGTAIGCDDHGLVYEGTYLAFDEPVILREYLPADIARRRSDETVAALSTAEAEAFRQGFTRFDDDARALASLNHRNVETVRDILEANGTAYMVFPRSTDPTLDTWFADKGRAMSPRAFQYSSTPLVDGLESLPDAGLRYRKPELGRSKSG
jgi:hypothetical protein